MPGGTGRLRVRGWGVTGPPVVFSLELEDCCPGMNTPCVFNVSVCRAEQHPALPPPEPKQIGVKWQKRCQAFVLLFVIPRTSAGPKKTPPTFMNRVSGARMSLALW